MITLTPRVALVMFVLLWSAGCEEPEEIRTYDAPKAVRNTQSTTEEESRMLAAIVPRGQRLWFFKLVAPAEAVEKLASDVDALFASIRAAEDNDNGVAWDTPKGWTERPESGMRLATLVTPAEIGQHELTIIGLGKTGDLDADIRNNVDRWRGQMGLPPGSGDSVTAIEGDLEGAVRVDLTGVFESESMAPPAMRKNTGFSSTPPAGWTERSAGSVRLVTFIAGEAEVAVTRFADFGKMSDPLENVNRWRGEAELSPITQQQLDEEVDSITLSGGPATYAEMLGPQLARVAAMSVRGDHGLVLQAQRANRRGETAARSVPVLARDD